MRLLYPPALQHGRRHMDVLKIAAFSDGNTGGNPAGVLISDILPDAADMQLLAAQVGFSETAFAAPEGDGWRVRYFSPETEVPFCGHATIALGAALVRQFGDGVFPLTLNQASITVEGFRDGVNVAAALQSPPTRSKPASPELISEALALFGYTSSDLDPAIPPALIHGGADHLVLALKSRQALAAMRYDLKAGQALMRREGLVTILLAYAETPRLSTRAIRLPPAASMRIRRQVPRRPPSPAICVTLAGRMAARSMSCKARTWACARACTPTFHQRPEVRSGFQAAPG
jgi:PhzF family phenazine biosynthesis protein